MQATAPSHPSPMTTTEAAAYDAGRAAGTQRWPLYVIGGLTMLIGAIAIALPLLSSLAAAFMTGTFLVASGIVGAVAAVRRKEGWDMAATFALSALSFLTGLLMIVMPVAGIIALTTMIIVYFFATGALRLFYGIGARAEGGGWMIALGALSLLVGVMLTLGLPFNAAWVPGVLLGLDLMIWGAMLVLLGARAGTRAARKPLVEAPTE